MTIIRKIAVFVVMLAAACCTIQAQDAVKELYKGQVHVSKVSVFQQDNRVHLRMRVTYSTDLLNRGETLYTAPVLQDRGYNQTFPAMVFNGKSKKWRVRNTDVIVVADDAYGHFHFDIEFSSRYEEWMQGASLCFASEEVLNNKLTNHYMDCVFNHVIVAASDDGQYISPSAVIDTDDYTSYQKTNVKSRIVEQRASAPLARKAETRTSQQGGIIHLRTNLLYDAALLPNLGLEYGVSPKVSVVLNAGGNWIKNDHKHWYWRVLTADVEGRYWLGKRPCYMGFQHKGHHVGIYGAVYRYDIELGGKGQMGDFAYGGGFSYGYSFPIGRRLSLDMALGVGYIGGKYKEYEPQDNCYVWLADKQRHYFGPTKAEVTLVWHLGY